MEGQVNLGEAIIKVNLVPSIPEIDPVFCNIFHGLKSFYQARLDGIFSEKCVELKTCHKNLKFKR